MQSGGGSPAPQDKSLLGHPRAPQWHSELAPGDLIRLEPGGPVWLVYKVTQFGAWIVRVWKELQTRTNRKTWKKKEFYATRREYSSISARSFVELVGRQEDNEASRMGTDVSPTEEDIRQGVA